LFESGPVDFAYASQTWDTTSSQCSVGDWNNGNANDFFGSLIFGEDFLPNRQLDCLFDCPAPDNSEKREMVEHHDKGWKQDLKSPSPTIGNDPSPSVEQLYEIRDLNPQASHGAAWVKYAPSGARYFKEWQEKTGDDIVYSCFDDFFNVVALNRAQPASGIRGILQEAGYGTGREYLAVSIEGPPHRLLYQHHQRHPGRLSGQRERPRQPTCGLAVFSGCLGIVEKNRADREPGMEK
jgi:hypothetical protein